MNHGTHLLLDMVTPGLWNLLPAYMRAVTYIEAVISSLSDIIRNGFESVGKAISDFFTGLFQ